MVSFMENPNLKWMRTGGSPILGHSHLVDIVWENENAFQNQDDGQNILLECHGIF